MTIEFLLYWGDHRLVLTSLYLLFENFFLKLYVMISTPSHLFWYGNLLFFLILGMVYSKLNSNESLGNSSKKFLFGFINDLKHKSSINDFKLILSRFFIVSLVSVYLIDINHHLADLNISIVDRLIEAGLPSLSIGLSSVSIQVLFAISLVFFYDFFYYVSHRLLHTIPTLWEFHKVHHSAQVLTPLTLARGDIFTIFYFIFLSEFSRTVSVISFFILFNQTPSPYLILGAPIGNFLVSFFQKQLNHSSVWVSYGIFGNIIFSPSCHQIHHSIERKHWNKNYGLVFPWFDMLFGTYFPAPKKPLKIVYGIDGEEEKEFNNLSYVEMLFFPIIKNYQRFFR